MPTFGTYFITEEVNKVINNPSKFKDFDNLHPATYAKVMEKLVTILPDLQDIRNIRHSIDAVYEIPQMNGACSTFYDPFYEIQQDLIMIEQKMYRVNRMVLQRYANLEARRAERSNRRQPRGEVESFHDPMPSGTMIAGDDMPDLVEDMPAIPSGHMNSF